MAKQRFGVNDAYRGTVGTVIGYEWRGRWCLRARPLHVRNPRTAKQQSNRQLFKQMVDLASHMKFALHKGLRSVSLGMHVTECNLFVKRNKECFSLDAEERMVVDWERLIVSEGEVAAPGFTDTALMDTRLMDTPLMDTPLMDTPLSQPQAAASSPNLGEQLNGKLLISGEMLMDTLLSQPQAAASSPNLGEQLNGKGRGKLPISGEQLDGKQPISGEQLDGNGRGRRYLGSSPKLGEGDRRRAVVEGCVEIPFEWDSGSGDDEVYVYAYCPEMEEGELSASAWRRSGSVQLTLPERWQGKAVHLYGFAVDEKGRGEQSKLDSAGSGRRYLGSSPKLGEGDRRGAVVEGCVEIPFEWDGGSGDDEVYVYAYCPEMEEGVLSASAWRRSGRVQLTLPERWQGKTVHLYGFAVDEKGAASATVYIGAMKMAKYPIRAATKDISPKSTVASQ